jgi:hypothetical protein
MLPLRQPMTPIAVNRQFNGHLSSDSRTKIITRYNCGFTPAAVALGFNLIDKTVRYTIEQDAIRNKSHSLPRRPRNKKYTDVEERNILRYVRSYPTSIYAQVKREVGLTCSTTIIKRILKEHGIVNWRAK